MTKKVLLTVICLSALALPALGASPLRIIRIDVPNHDVVYSLARELRLDVANAQQNCITAYADDAMIERVRSRGFPVTVLVEDYQAQAERDLVTYYTYVQACSILVAQATAYPAITKLETLGFSAGNRMIPVMKVTADAANEHPRPRVRISGAHHGNEKQGTEICLAFLQYLTSGYGINPSVTALVDSREFWILPVFNPDGHVDNSRYNDAGVDLNRDYGWEWEGYSTPFSQPETRAMNAHSAEHPPTVEFEYHTTAAYVNYMWDNTPIDPPDSAWVIALSERYADSTYGSPTTELEAINGWDWYEVHGSCQDCSFGSFGAMSTTIETDLPSQRARIDSICVANRRALLYQAAAAGWGINGLVFDSITGAPLYARVEFTSPRRWPVCTAPATGDFHKMLAPGTYTLKVSSNGYLSRTLAGVVVPDTGGADIDIALARPVTEPLNYAQRVSAVKRADNNHTLPGVAVDALGEPDGRFYRVGPSSNIALLLDPVVACHNREGSDITVTATGSYTVAVRTDEYGVWTSLGSGSGTQSFDLGSLDSCRFIRIVETSNCQLDAVSYVGSPWAGVSEIAPSLLAPSMQVSPNPCRSGSSLHVAVSGGAPSRVSLIDVAGRTVRTFDTRGSSLVTFPFPPGVYYLRAEANGRSAAAKLTVQ